MWKVIKDFFEEEDGLGTVEIVVIIAILVGLALLFKNAIGNFVGNIFKGLSGSADNVTPNNTNAAVEANKLIPPK